MNRHINRYTTKIVNYIPESFYLDIRIIVNMNIKYLFDKICNEITYGIKSADSFSIQLAVEGAAYPIILLLDTVAFSEYDIIAVII